MVRTVIGRFVRVLAVALAGAMVLPAFAWAGSYGWGARTSPTTEDITGVSFTDASDGWIVTSGGHVFHTEDGGSQWTTVSVGVTENWAGVRFADSSHGWITGQNNTIVRTVDGGAHWETLHTAYGAALARPFALDASRVWIPVCGAGGLLAGSSDAGSTWGYGYAPVFSGFLGAAFSDPSNGWVVGSAGAIYRTHDGGSTLQTRTVDSFTQWLQAVSVVDTQTAIAVSSSGSSVCLWDNGVGWSSEVDTSPLGSLYGIACTGERGEAFAVGYGGVIHTANYGSPWVKVADLGSASLKDVTFPDPFTGFAAGDGGVLFAYTAPDAPVAHSIEATDVSGLWVTWDPSPSAAFYQIRQPGGSLQTGVTTTTTSVSTLSLGENSFMVRAVTAEGLMSRWSTGTITIHELVPAKPALTAPSAVTTAQVTVSWLPVFGAQSGYEYRLNGGSVTATYATSVTFADLPYGENTISVRARSYFSTGAWQTVKVIYAIPAAQKLTLYRTPASLAYPATAVTISGNTGGHAATVTVEVKPAGGVWRSTGVVMRSSSSGVLANRTVSVRSNTSVRLVSTRTPYWFAGVSNAVTVEYRPLVKAPSQARAYVGHRLRTSVRVYTPLANAGASVVLRYYRRVNGAWKRVATLTASPGSWSSGSTRYARSYTPARRGTWKVVATYYGGARYLGATSSKRFTVY